jgi:exodeoxyribonuclease V alpha subunit
MNPILRTGPRSQEEDLLDRARALGLLSATDQQFSRRLSDHYGERRPGVRWALALASRQEASGHVCADLVRLAADGLMIDLAGEAIEYDPVATHADVESWLEEIAQSALVDAASGRGAIAMGAGVSGEGVFLERRPLILDEAGRLYLRSAFESQARLATAVLERAERADLEVDWDLADAGFERLVPTAADEDAAPRRALRVGLVRPLSIVTGGPGTGKTTLIVRLIALLIEQAFAAGRPAPTIRLLAPTGKAAAAMSSSFARQRGELDIAPEVAAALPRTAQTIHRALHRQTRRDALGRARDFRLEDDVVVVDEASMVDLDLMARLFKASDAVGRVVLLGDPGQLASVEAGAVLAELCPTDPEARAGDEGTSVGLAGSIVVLERSHRFGAQGGIGRLAAAIAAGDADGAIALLDDPEMQEIERVPIESIDATRSQLIEANREMQRAIAAAGSLAEKLDCTGSLRVLCAHRKGPLGVEALCAVLDDAAAAVRQTTTRSGWWAGRMILVTRNAPEQGLWNGDVGLIDETSAGLRALFLDPDRDPDKAADPDLGGVRAFSSGRLPAHESAIAMSVHKSQGSEFDGVELVLGDLGSRLMTRELLYTGVTRARTRLRIHASEAVLREAIARRVRRDSGLSDLLWAD